MTAIYKGQSALRIRLTAGVDITGALSQKIKYKKPSGVTGEWAAAVENAPQGIIYHDILTRSEIDEDGTWSFWAYIKFSDGREAPGSPILVKVYREGQSE